MIDVSVESEKIKDHDLERQPSGEEERVKPGNDEEDIHSNLPMREVSFSVPGGGTVSFNPVTSLFGILVLWGLAVWCMVDPEGSKEILSRWQSQTTVLFTWFYVGTQPMFLIFLFVIFFKFGDQKLGKEGDQPEFDTPTYFAMIFSAGVAVGLFYYGVSEPLAHRTSNWFAASGFHSQNEVDQFAINLSVFHWGLNAWCVYSLVGVAVGIMSYREGYPMSIRSCFVPLLGNHCWGWLGDILDGFTIIVVVSGVCTSLGLGAIQIVTGLQYTGILDEGLSEDSLNNARVWTIWVVTLVATASVVSGLNYGIKTLSQTACVMGVALWFFVLVLDQTPFLLNIMVQEVGYYLSTVVPLSFHTDAFAQLQDGQGRVDEGSADEGWMNGWTIFYLAWWTAWSTFVGLFISRISKGRTIREVIGYTLGAPLVFVIAWFSVFGGAGIRSARRAEELKVLGLEQYGDESYYQVEPNSTCYNPPSSFTSGSVSYQNEDPWVGPVCGYDSDNSDAAFFNVLYQYGNFGPFLSVFSLLTIAIFFVTSSDSGSLIVDFLASNGKAEHHWSQRVFWALTEGALASGLLIAGGSNALGALQSVSIVAGLPFTAVLCCIMAALWKTLSEHAAGENFHAKKHFAMPVYGGVFDVIELALSLGQHRPDRSTPYAPTLATAKSFFVALLCPFIPFYQIQKLLFNKERQAVRNKITTALVAFLFFAWVGLFIATVAEDGIYAFGWTAYLGFVFIIAGLRRVSRRRFNLEGGFLSDLFSSLFLYPQVLAQILFELQTVRKASFDDDETSEGNVHPGRQDSSEQEV